MRSCVEVGGNRPLEPKHLEVRLCSEVLQL